MHGELHGGFAFECQVREHGGHQRLIREMSAKGRALARIGNRLHGGAAQNGRAAQHAVQPRVAGHFDDGGNASAFLAHENAPGVLQLHFRAGVAAVAYLVLEALHTHGVLASVGTPARHEKTGMTAELTACRGHASHHQMGVAHGGREKPFVAAQQILAAATSLMHGASHRGVGAHVRAALFFRHAHAYPDGFFLVQGQIACVVLVAEQPGLQLAP